MRKQDLLIVSISTIAAGAVTALAGVAQPLALIGASTLGAMGGSLLVSKSELAGTGGDRPAHRTLAPVGLEQWPSP